MTEQIYTPKEEIKSEQIFSSEDYLMPNGEISDRYENYYIITNNPSICLFSELDGIKGERITRFDKKTKQSTHSIMDLIQIE